jgi:ComF family protein
VILPSSSPKDTLSRVFPAFVTDERLLVLIHLLKFARRERLAPWLAAAMAPHLPDFSRAAGLGELVVVPVPMDRGAQLRRGFNQAEGIARVLASNWRLALETRALIKVRATKAQSTLGRGERLVNVEGAFQADPNVVRNLDIILVDDLVTTGATLRACAAALGGAGARRVVAVCAGYRDERAPETGAFLNLDNDFRSE